MKALIFKFSEAISKISFTRQLNEASLNIFNMLTVL